LSWKWDRRFETVLAEFSVDKKENVRAILERYLNATWDSSNVGNAPDIVRAIHDNFGGLRPGQFLFTTAPNREVLIFCTSWPWGDGKEISIRIGPAHKEVSDSEGLEEIELFRVWFGV
jgi:hypothetical protein